MRFPGSWCILPTSLLWRLKQRLQIVAIGIGCFEFQRREYVVEESWEEFSRKAMQAAGFSASAAWYPYNTEESCAARQCETKNGTGTVTVQDILRSVTGNVRSLFQSFSRRPEICEQTWKALNWVSEEMEIELNVLKYSSSTWNSSKGLWPESDFTMAAWYHDSLVVTGNTM